MGEREDKGRSDLLAREGQITQNLAGVYNLCICSKRRSIENFGSITLGIQRITLAAVRKVGASDKVLALE